VPLSQALLSAGANPCAKTRRGTTPRKLAGRTTCRSGSGSAAAKCEQKQILVLLQRWGK
jgi:hypothetical protein